MGRLESVEVERALISGLLQYPEHFDDVLQIVSHLDFADEASKCIMEAMESLAADSQPIDVVTVSSRLSEFGKLDRVGGFEGLIQLTDAFTVPDHLTEYAHIIKEKSRLRSLMNLASSIATMIQQDRSSEDIIDRVESAIRRIEETLPTNDYLMMPDALSKTIELIEEIERKRKQGLPLTGVTTGYRSLDNMLGGLHKGDLVIIAARPSMGKTAFALNLAINAAKRGTPVAFFSLEMSTEQLVQRMLAIESLVPLHNIRHAYLTPEQWQRVRAATERLFKAPILIDDVSQLDTRTLRSKVRRAKKENQLEVVFIDYLQLMNSNKMLENRQQEISEISRTLKLIAREMEITIVALSQLSRAVEQREDKRPRLSDLRESGAIEQDSDVVIFLYRDEYYKRENVSAPHEVEVIVAKQRNGPIGTVQMVFNPDTTRFFEAEQGVEYLDV